MSGAAPDPGTRVTPAEATEGCRYCWMCRHVCPVGHVTHRETYTPHAWALTIESVARGQLTWNREAVDVLYACADCGLCRAHCVTDRPLPDAIAAARAEVAGAKLAAPVVYAIDEKLRTTGNPYGVKTAATTRRTGEIGLLAGDAADCLMPGTVEAVVGLLAAAGTSPVRLGVGRSTGWLASSLGLQATAVALAEALVAEVKAAGIRELLVLSPADRWAIERVYPDRLGLTWPADVAVRDVTSVLHDALRSGRLRFTPNGHSIPYAYHDPCHSPRIARDHAAPRALLAAALGEATARPLFWREGRAHPCGAVGGLEFTHPEIAGRLAAARVADAKAAGAERLIADDPGCLQHLGTTTGAVVQSFYELLATRVV
jgi:Fe-S oxidoreductase